LKYFNQTWSGHGLSDVALSVGLPSTKGDEKDGKRIVTFIHLIPQAISFESGDVMHGHLKIVPQRCKRNISTFCSVISGPIPVYKEVFTISQFWGKGFYHGTVENLPRMALDLPFLLKHPHIKIHVAGRMEYLTLLGIDNSRLITKPIIKADILYMPPGGPCGNSPLLSTQILASTLASNVKGNALNKRDTIVLIKRSKKRWFDNHYSILRMIMIHASKLNLKVEVFNDNPLPHINKTVEMFSRALIVIGPHGAGASNLLLSQPGTLFIEGLCYDSTNRANLCYRNMAQALGLRYYGLIYPDQCMAITANQIETPLLEFLRAAVENKLILR